MKSAWVSLVLHEGLGFPEDTISLQSTGSIYGQSVQWPLGALLYHTRYLPLREVQLQKLIKSPIADSNRTNSWTFHSLIHSSFALPLLVVLSVVVILLVCRRRRPSLRTYLSSSQGLTRSVSQASFLKLHRRTSSVNNQLSVLGSLSRNTSSSRLSAIV
jgi:ectonucleoside triphosphate diphosphohydrolase 4